VAVVRFASAADQAPGQSLYTAGAKLAASNI